MKKMFCEGYKIFLVVILLSLITILNFSSCQTTEPPVTQGKIILESLDASSTEVWLKLSVQELNLPQNVTVTRNDTIIENLTLDKADTVIYDEGLLPAKTYKYRAIIQPSGHTTIQSPMVTVITMDTTSHNFTWHTFTFGGANGSRVLRDVAIINENDIWAVGEIYTEDTYTYDSAGVWQEPYNAVHWNGQEWKLRRIYYQGQCSAVNVPPLKAIISFSENEFIVTNGGSTGFFNGENITYLDCDVHPLLDGAISSMYGYSKNDYYVVGGKGTIVHYNGTSWEKIELDEDISEYYLSDIYGTADGEVYIVGESSNKFGKSILINNKSGKFKIVKHSDTVPSNQIFQPNLYGGLLSVWIDENSTLFVGGWYLYRYKNDNWKYVESFPSNRAYTGDFTDYRGYIYEIRGKSSNDIFICGSENTILHFNGKSWKHLVQPYNPQSDNIFRSIDVRGNIGVAVGEEFYGNNAKIILFYK